MRTNRKPGPPTTPPPAKPPQANVTGLSTKPSQAKPPQEKVVGPPTTLPPAIENKQQKENEELKKENEKLKKEKEELKKQKEESESRAKDVILDVVSKRQESETNNAPTNNESSPENTNNQSIDSKFKPLITGFLGQLKTETFFINEEITNTINQMVDEAITKINEGDIQKIKDALKKVKNIIIKNKDNIPADYKDKSKKYIDAIEKLDFDNLSNPLNIDTIFNLGKGVATEFVGKIMQPNNNDKTTTENKASPGFISNKINDGKIVAKRFMNTIGDTGQQVSGNLGNLIKTKEMDQASEVVGNMLGNMGLGKSKKGAPPAVSSALAAAMPGMSQGASGALGALGERLIIKKIDETFLKIQQQICATFNDYKKQIGEALIKKMVEKIEEHSTAFKEYTEFRYDDEAKKYPEKSALNTSNVFFQIYDNVRAQIQYKQVDFKKVDFSDQIFSKYEAWKKVYEEKKNNFLLSGGGNPDEKDLYNTMKAAYDAISLPEDAAKKMTTGLFKKIFGVEMTEEQIEKLKEQNAENEKNGLDENGKPNGIKKPEKKNENVLEEAVKKSIDHLKIPFTNAQLDLIYEKVFFGLHNPSVLIVKLLCNIDDKEREKLIKDLTIQDTRDKMKAYHNEYMANKKGWPERTKTLWEQIVCNMNRHTDCPENLKVPPLLEPLTGAATGAAVTGPVPGAVPGAVTENAAGPVTENAAVTGAAVTGAAVTENAAVPGAVQGGYEKYINNPRKTKRKRLVKKGKRKNKTYHRRVSV
jgi:hypothetical protein